MKALFNTLARLKPKHEYKHPVNTIRGKFERFGRFVKKSLYATFLACGLSSAMIVNYGDTWASDTLEDYAQANDIPMELFEGLDTDKMRVYNGSVFSYLHRPGQMTANVYKLGQEMEGLSTVERGMITIAAGVSYPINLFASIKDAITQHPFGAFAMPGVKEDDISYIRPSGEAPISELVSVFTGIDEKDLPAFADEPHIVSAIVLAHEAEHASSTMLGRKGMFDGLVTLTLEGETTADTHAMIKVTEVFNESDVPEIMRHGRAMSPFSREGSSHVGHATALALDAYFNERAMPTREEAYFTNAYLGEIVRREMMGFDKDTSSISYQEAVYNVMAEFVASPPEFAPPLAVRAAELYMEAYDYFENYEMEAGQQRAVAQLTM